MIEDAGNGGGAGPRDEVDGRPNEKHQSADLSKVDRVRKDFPETWLWSEMESGYLKILDVAFLHVNLY